MHQSVPQTLLMSRKCVLMLTDNKGHRLINRGWGHTHIDNYGIFIFILDVDKHYKQGLKAARLLWFNPLFLPPFPIKPYRRGSLFVDVFLDVLTLLKYEIYANQPLNFENVNMLCK